MPDGLQFGVTNELLTVIIDIDFRDSWKFPTVPGTWRRLTMNIFGNALKYTHAGYIRIKLEARAISSVVSAIDNNPSERTMVTLTISDTGRGMSSDFLKTKVFMPFTQV
jgi:signal transduction histidine kinase